MEKSFILSVAMMAMVSSVSAQEGLTTRNDCRQTAKVTACKFDKSDRTPSLLKGNAAAPRKDYESGLYYDKPEGTFFLTLYDDKDNAYPYIVGPSFTDLTFRNLSTNPSQTAWNINGTSLEGDEENNLVHRFGKSTAEEGYVSSWYLPTLTSEKDEYTYAEGIVTVIDPQTVQTINSNLVTSYYGHGLNQWIFGTEEDVYDFGDGKGKVPIIQTAFYRIYEKPVTPFMLHEISINIYTDESHSSKVLPDGKALTATICKVTVDENGRTKLGDPIAVLKCEGDNAVIRGENPEVSGLYYGTATFANYELNVVGIPEVAPVVIDQAFAVLVEGFDDPDINIGFTAADNGSDLIEYDKGTPTYMTYRLEDGTIAGDLYYHGISSRDRTPYSYVCPLMFTIEWDGIDVQPGFPSELTAPVEGGSASTEEDGEVIDYVVMCSTFPILVGEEEEENYVVEGCPEWLTIEADDSYYEGTETTPEGWTILGFTAEPLPEGVTGREATIHFVSNRGGHKSVTPIVIKQGEVQGAATSIQSVNENEGLQKVAFNVLGQRVGGEHKGIIIRNGKKFVVK